MNRNTMTLILLLFCVILAGHIVRGQKNNNADLTQVGMQTFRFETFGDEAWWGDTLQLHRAIEGAKLGGVGPGISPSTALSLGLKVDLEALPQSLVQQLKEGKVDLNDPSVTLALLKLKSVVGVTGNFNPDGSLKSMEFSAPSVIPRLITRSFPGSVIGWTAGQTVI